MQYVENHFVESYYPTIENTFSKNIKYKGQEFATEIIDTAGQDEYSILNSKHSIGIHGYVLVYSITSKSSFEMVKIVRDKILNHTVCQIIRIFKFFTNLLAIKGTEWVPIVVVGNKSDLHMQRAVTAEEGKALANEWKCAWTEASARHNENVARAFELIISEIEKQANPSPPGDGKGCVIA